MVDLKKMKTNLDKYNKIQELKAVQKKQEEMMKLDEDEKKRNKDKIINYKVELDQQRMMRK